ncbi:MAG TPA: OmpA family protein [Syntrophorhabdaceae bacterium]|nr:OmpA family protein [Syntrophorhabdaceae bacterium]
MKNIITALICLGVVLSVASCGCGIRSMVVLIPDPDGRVGQVVVENDSGQKVLNEANQSVELTDRKTPPGKVTKLSNEEISSIFSDALAARPMPPARFILYFLHDSTELTVESRAVVPKVIQTIRERNSTDVVISGHTDTVGTKEHNYKLGLDRANALYDILITSGAVPASVTVTSHGEGNPLVKTADNVTEPRNRRTEIAIK